MDLQILNLGKCNYLYIFAEASQYAYGAVVYICYLHQDFINCSFVIKKSRLVPIQKKSKSIPRLERRAAVTTVRLKDTCTEELKMKVDNVYFYSDSKTIINYICMIILILVYLSHIEFMK